MLLLLIGCAVGAVLVFSGKIDTLKQPFITALGKYNDYSPDNRDKILVEAWDKFQQDVSKIAAPSLEQQFSFTFLVLFNEPTSTPLFAHFSSFKKQMNVKM